MRASCGRFYGCHQAKIPLLIVPTLRVVTPPRTLRVRQTTRVQAGEVTRSVTGCIPTQSGGTIKIKSFPAEAGPTDARAAFSGTGFSREEASPGADSIADQPHFLCELARECFISNTRYPSDRSHAPRGNAAPDAPRPADDVHSGRGEVTRSVTGCLPTQSGGTINFKHQTSGGCPDPFVSKLTPTSPPRLICS